MNEAPLKRRGWGSAVPVLGVVGVAAVAAVAAPAPAGATDGISIAAPSSSADVASIGTTPWDGSTSVLPDLLDCPGGSFCFWSNTDYKGALYTRADLNNQADLSTSSQAACPTGNWKDCASSYRNATFHSVEMWTDPSYGGTKYTAPGNSNYASMSVADNAIASIKFIP